MAAGSQPVTADKGAIAQLLVAIEVPSVDQGNNDVGDFHGEVWQDCLRDGRHLVWYA